MESDLPTLILLVRTQLDFLVREVGNARRAAVLRFARSGITLWGAEIPRCGNPLCAEVDDLFGGEENPVGRSGQSLDGVTDGVGRAPRIVATTPKSENWAGKVSANGARVSAKLATACGYHRDSKRNASGDGS
jgi:hypothetical protein